MTDVSDLLLLQGIDSEIAATAAKLAELELRLSKNEEVESATATFDERAGVAEDLLRKQRKLEASIEDLTAKISPDEVRLYDGSVRNPKELAAIQIEVGHLRERRAALEDELIELLERVELASLEMARAKDVLDEAVANWNVAASGLRSEKEAFEVRIADLTRRRDDARARTARPALARYDALLGRKGGLAVASVKGGTCQGCRVLLPDAIRRRAVTSSELIPCPNCERILSVTG